MLWVAMIFVVVASCTPVPDPEPLRLLAQAEPLRDLLADCSLGEETEAARWCAAFEERVSTCEAVEATCSDAEGACSQLNTVTCRAKGEMEALGLPRGIDLRIRGPLSMSSAAAFDLQAVVAPERIRARLLMEGVGSEPWARWLPSGSLAPPRLTAAGAFLVAQYRPGGGLVPPRSGEATLAERLYGLRSELFSAAVLDGDVELVLYPPNERELFPRIAAFLGAKRRDLAVRGMESYIEELRRQWPIQRLDYEYDGRQGACLDNLRVMPEFAPCYLATPDGLALGWNRQSLEQAMPTDDAPPGGSFSAAPEAARLVIDAQALALADRRLAQARDRRPAYAYPIRALSLRSVPAPQGAAFEIEAMRVPEP